MGRGQSPPVDGCTGIQPPSVPRLSLRDSLFLFLTLLFCSGFANRGNDLMGASCTKRGQEGIKTGAYHNYLMHGGAFQWKIGKKINASSVLMLRRSLNRERGEDGQLIRPKPKPIKS